MIDGDSTTIPPQVVEILGDMETAFSAGLVIDGDDSIVEG